MYVHLSLSLSLSLPSVQGKLTPPNKDWLGPELWGNTNRVVSNRVVSKGPLYPSKTEMIISLVFDTTPFICL